MVRCHSARPKDCVKLMGNGIAPIGFTIASMAISRLRSIVGILPPGARLPIQGEPASARR